MDITIEGHKSCLNIEESITNNTQDFYGYDIFTEISQSPKFTPVFKNHQESTDGTVVFENSTPEAFEVLLKYIYYGHPNSQLTNSVNISEVEAISRLFDVGVLADKYQVGDLFDNCKETNQ